VGGKADTRARAQEGKRDNVEGKRVVAAGRTGRPEGCGSRKSKEARGLWQQEEQGGQRHAAVTKARVRHSVGGADMKVSNVRRRQECHNNKLSIQNRAAD